MLPSWRCHFAELNCEHREDISPAAGSEAACREIKIKEIARRAAPENNGRPAWTEV
jgi:hypothetical protein